MRDGLVFFLLCSRIDQWPSKSSEQEAQFHSKPGATELSEISVKPKFGLHFKKLVNEIHAAADLNAINLGLRQQILNLYDAEMATIYLVNSGKREIFSWVVLSGERLKQIRLPINCKSIAGYVAKTGKIVNISNVYDQVELLNIDPELSFDSSWDRKTGAKTIQILSLPILYRNSLLGVLQLINKKEGRQFTVQDQKHLMDLAETLGLAFYNQRKNPSRPTSKYELLIRNGIITEKEFVRAQGLASRRGGDIETVLRKDFKISKLDLSQALSHFYGITYADLNAEAYRPAALSKGINLEYFRKAACIPMTGNDGGTILFVNDPRDQGRIQEIAQVLRAADYELRLTLKEDIEKYLEIRKSVQGARSTSAPDQSFDDILESMKEGDSAVVSTEDEIEGEAPDDRAIVVLVRKIIEDAHRQGASDIHIEPYGSRQDGEVRFRVDGRCSNVLIIPKGHVRAVISRFKLLGKLDISERRRPQDGKMIFKTSAGRKLELRISTVPTAEGNEDIVLRLLADSEPLPLPKIMPEQTFRRFSEVVKKPYGIVLVVGPTGSGKTTTLHSALGFINTPERKIWTAEDPVEITQYRLRQVQVNQKIGLTFAVAMRAFLRADPDVIMVGEMRDKETASMGIEASLTGHLVLSTLHTNSAPETITRLVDMGMDPFNFADALLGILAQRLVKTLCVKCRKPYRPDRAEFDHLRQQYGGELFDKRLQIPFSEKLKFYKAVGCETCGNTGYRGRMGLYELLTGSDAMKKLIISGATVEAIRAMAVREGMRTLLQEGIHQVFLGQTDFSQVKSVCSQ
jgi:type II secretory ATPase GspE/PulE/Tfp pilus assembly ATPase PilB-like protein